jgi:type IV pilus assembly protein PilQ
VKRLLVLLLCVMFAAAGLRAAQTVVDEEVPPAKKLISIDFPDTPLGTVMSVLSLKTGYKFVTDGDLAKKKVILTLKDVTAEEALNALLDAYNLYYVRQGETNIYVIKSKSDTVVTTVSKVFFLNFATAKELEPTLKTKLSKNGAINSDEKSNSIIVTDTADNIDAIDQLIRTLDIPPLQVLLEAKIIDVKIDNSIKYGMDLGMYRTYGYYQSPLDLQAAALAGTTSKSSAVYPEVIFGQTLSPGLGASGAGSLRVSLLHDDMNVQAYIEALKTDTNAKILTNPRLVVLNNKEASIEIVEQIPYTQQVQSGIGSGVTAATIAFKDVGIKLVVKPQITRDGTIILNVKPEQSFRTGETLTGVPVIYTSKTNTTFMLENGETAVISGLVKENDAVSEFKIPLLGDIPIIGNLFKKYSKEKVRNELTVIITAKILK